jgi:hypothetical protein
VSAWLVLPDQADTSSSPSLGAAFRLSEIERRPVEVWQPRNVKPGHDD